VGQQHVHLAWNTAPVVRGSMPEDLTQGVDIQISTEVPCLGVLLDSKLTFAPHVRRLSGKCFYHLRQLKTVRRSLTEDAAKSLVHAFVTSHIDYCNSVIHGARAAHIQPLQYVLNAAARLILQKRKYDHITSDIRDRLHWLPIQQRLEYKICLLIFVITRWHQSTLQFLPPLAEVISVPQHVAIWRYLDPERRPTDKEVFPSLVRHCGTLCSSLLVTHL